MTHLANIFAQSEGDPTIKIVLAVVAGIIWVVAQAASAWKDRQKSSPPPVPRREPRAEPPTVGYPQGYQQQRQGPPQLPRPVPQQRRPMQDTPRPQSQQGQRTGQKRSNKKAEQARRRAAEELQRMTREAPPPPPVTRVPVRHEAYAEAVAETVKVEQSPSTGQRVRALLRPKNLRKEFILTEVLQKPISMRDEIR
jgi:hypothetical protein